MLCVLEFHKGKKSKIKKKCNILGIDLQGSLYSEQVILSVTKNCPVLFNTKTWMNVQRCEWFLGQSYKIPASNYPVSILH